MSKSFETDIIIDGTITTTSLAETATTFTLDVAQIGNSILTMNNVGVSSLYSSTSFQLETDSFTVKEPLSPIYFTADTTNGITFLNNITGTDYGGGAKTGVDEYFITVDKDGLFLETTDGTILTGIGILADDNTWTGDNTFSDNSTQTTSPNVIIEQLGTGDANMQFKVAAETYSVGIDNSVSGDPFIIADGTDLAGTTNVALYGAAKSFHLNQIDDFYIFTNTATITTGGYWSNSGVGDMKLTMVANGSDWTLGTDGTDGDFKISEGNQVGTNDALIIRETSLDAEFSGDIRMVTNATYLYADVSGGTATRIHGINASDVEYIGAIDQNVTSTFIGTTTDTLSLRTNSATGVYVDATQQVGIGGVTTLSSTLHVYEDTTATNTSAGITVEQDGTGDCVVQHIRTGGQRWVYGVGNADTNFKWKSGTDIDSSPDMELDTSGNLEIVGSFTGKDATRKEVTDDATTTHTVTTADNYKLRRFTSSSAVTVTVDTGSLTNIGDTAEVDQYGTGLVTIAAGTATLRVNGNATLVSSGQYSRISIQKMTSTEYRVFGELEPA